MAVPMNLQMYTVRDDASADLAKTLSIVKSIGYAGVELAGYAGHDVETVKSLLEGNGLTAISAHVPFDSVKNDLSRVIDDAKLLGYEYVIVPWIGAPYTDSLDGYRLLGDELAAAGETLSENGLSLAYHNHAFEFEKKDGDAFALDILFERAGPKVLVELDTFWVKKAGVDPAAYLARYTGRVPLVHLKDMTPEGDFAPVGAGTIDYTGSLIPAAKVAGAQHFVVEQDRCTAQTPLESIKISYDNLKSWGIAL